MAAIVLIRHLPAYQPLLCHACAKVYLRFSSAINNAVAFLAKTVAISTFRPLGFSQAYKLVYSHADAFAFACIFVADKIRSQAARSTTTLTGDFTLLPAAALITNAAAVLAFRAAGPLALLHAAAALAFRVIWLLFALSSAAVVRTFCAAWLFFAFLRVVAATSCQQNQQQAQPTYSKRLHMPSF
jgi:hypothetical protein